MVVQQQLSVNEAVVALLRSLSSVDGKLIKDATTEFKSFLKTPESTGQLLGVLASKHCNAAIRTAAGVMLHKKVKTFKAWSEEERVMAKAILLDMLPIEQDKAIQRNLTELAARIFSASYTLKDDGTADYWLQLVEFIHSCISCPLEQRTLGFSLLYALLEGVTDDISPLFDFLTNALSAGLQDKESNQVKYTALKSLSTLVTDTECWPGAAIYSEEDGKPLDGADEQKYDKQMEKLALVVNLATPVVKSLLHARDVTFDTDLFDVFASVVNHSKLAKLADLRESIELAVEVIGARELDEFIRKGALQYIIDSARARSSLISKNPVVFETIFTRIFAIMCTCEESEREMDSLLQTCAQAIDSITQRLPSSTVVPLLQSCIEPIMKPDQPKFTRRAAFLTLAVSVEGCCRYYAEHCLESLIVHVLEGIKDPESIVSLSALFALGELLSYVEGNANQYGPIFMPVILEALTKVKDINYEQADADTQLFISRLFYSIEEACECLDNDLVDYLNDLFHRLFYIQKNNQSVRLQEFVFESLSFAVSAVDQLIEPWVNDLLAVLSQCLKPRDVTNEQPAFTEALSALSTVFRYANTPQVRAHSDSAAEFASALLHNEDADAAERSGAYDVLAALTNIYKENISDQLVHSLVECTGKTFAIDGDIKLPSLRNGASSNSDDIDIGGDHENGLHLDDSDMDDDDDDDDDDEDDSSDDDEFELFERDYADERSSALGMISDLAINAELKLVGHFDRLWTLVHRQLDHPEEDIQNSAARCACCLLVMCYNVASKTVKEGKPLPAGAVNEQRIETLLKKTYQELEEKVRTANQHSFASSALNAIQILVGGFDKSFFSVIPVDHVANLIESVLMRKVECFKDTADPESDGEEPELDSLVTEAAGDLLPTCANALNQDQHTCETFERVFTSCIGHLLNQLKQGNSTRKSFILATLACTLNNQDRIFMEPQLALEVFDTFLNDNHEELVQNCIYGIRVLVSKKPEFCAPHFSNILNKLHEIVKNRAPIATQGESKKSSLRDNLCGCTGQILNTIAQYSPNDEASMRAVFEFAISMLPLRKDLENYGPLYEALIQPVIIKASFADTDDLVDRLVRIAFSLIVKDDDSDLSQEGKLAVIKYLVWQTEYKKAIVLKALENYSDEQKVILESKLRQEQ